ncbi:MAG: hypothetical protein ACJ76S_04555 [Solirubrobacteraceae bacterium]
MLSRMLGRPRLVLIEPTVRHTPVELGPTRDVHDVAQVTVANQREAGGDRATARDVVPEIEVFDVEGRRRLARYRGWDSASARDLPPSAQHLLYVAEKLKSWRDCHFVEGSPSLTTGTRRRGNTFRVRVSVRAGNLRPVHAEFVLINEGAGKSLSFWQAPKR